MRRIVLQYLTTIGMFFEVLVYHTCSLYVAKAVVVFGGIRVDLYSVYLTPTAATAIRSSCAIEPTIPAGQIGAPNVLRRIGRPAKPIEFISSCATRHAAPLARRLSTAEKDNDAHLLVEQRKLRLARSYDGRSAAQARRGHRSRAGTRDHESIDRGFLRLALRFLHVVHQEADDTLPGIDGAGLDRTTPRQTNRGCSSPGLPGRHRARAATTPSQLSAVTFLSLT